MGEPRAIVCTRFMGGDTETSPLALGEHLLKTGEVWFPSVGNFYSPDGTVLIKRPGVTAAVMTGFAITPPVYDLARLKLVSTTAQGNDVLAALFQVTGVPFVGTVIPSTWVCSTAGGWSTADTDRRMRLVVAGNSAAILPLVTASSTEPYLSPASPGTYYITSMANPMPLNDDGSYAAAAIAAWHKAFMIRAGNPHARNPNRVVMSDFNQPIAPYPPLNNLNVAEEGQYGVIGMLSTGDILYMGKSGCIVNMTGSSMGNFRVRATSLQYGIAGIRGADKIGPEAAVAFLTERKGPLGATVEVPNPRNIGLLVGGELQVIGDRILTYIRVGSDATIDTQVQNWTALQGVAMMPQRTLTAAAKRILLFTPKTGGFWPWTLASAVAPTCLREAGGTMYIGTAAGSGLMYFDDTTDYDTGANRIGGTLDFPVIPTIEDAVIDRVTVVCSQTTAGVNWSVSLLRKDTGAYDIGNAKTFTPTAVKDAYSVSFTGGTGVRASRQNSIRIQAPVSASASVGCKIYKVIIWLKSGLGK